MSANAKLSSDGSVDDEASTIVDLAPMIVRQRLVIEGLCEQPLGEKLIVAYLSELADVCEMIRLNEPVTHRSERYGWAGWVHWETSGAHLYAWEQPIVFFSVDIYTCKKFDTTVAIDFTRDRLRAFELESREY